MRIGDSLLKSTTDYNAKLAHSVFVRNARRDFWSNTVYHKEMTRKLALSDQLLCVCVTLLGICSNIISSSYESKATFHIRGGC